MFRRNDGLIVTQAEHSRLSGELALVFGRYFGQMLDPQACRTVERLAGAIALHDWPHFGGSVADVIEIGQKTTEQQRELAGRLMGKIPVDPFTELLMRWHWKMLSAREQSSDDSPSVLHSEHNQRRIIDLSAELEFELDDVHRFASWTRVCDAAAFYISRGHGAATKQVLPDLGGEKAWEFDFRVQADAWRVSPIRAGGPGVVAHDGETPELEPWQGVLSLLAYESDGYPHRLVPVMKVIRCTLCV